MPYNFGIDGDYDNYAGLERPLRQSIPDTLSLSFSWYTQVSSSVIIRLTYRACKASLQPRTRSIFWEAVKS